MTARRRSSCERAPASRRLIGLAAPALDLVLAAGERVSRVVAPEDDYIPIRPPSERLELPGRARRGGLRGRR